MGIPPMILRHPISPSHIVWGGGRPLMKPQHILVVARVGAKAKLAGSEEREASNVS